MKRIVIATVVVALAAASAARAQSPAGLKIGVFDPQRVSEETAEGKRVQAKLTSFADKKRAELAAKEKDLQDLQGQLNSQALSLSAEKRATLEKDVQKRMLELQQAQDGAQKEMQLEVAEAQNGFRDQLLAVLEQFGRDEAFSLIIDRQAAAYANPSIDVTTAIVDRFNKMFPAKTEAPAAEKAPTPEKSPSPAPPKK